MSTFPSSTLDVPFRPTADDAIFDQSAALTRLDDDYAFLCELADLFIHEAPNRLAAMAAAVSAVALDDVAALAHNLKGSACHFVASRSVSAAQRLENAAAAGDLSEVTNAYQHLIHETDTLLDRLRGLRGAALATHAANVDDSFAN